MKKQEKRYKVIQTTTHDYGDGNIQVFKKEHYTKGVSEAQARSRVMHRLGYNQYNCIIPWYGDGARIETFKAEEVIN